MRKRITNFLIWLKYVFWTKPTAKPDPPKASEVVQNYVVINYCGQKINLRIDEVPFFNAMSRSDKRAMSKRFEVMEKKGMLRFTKINGRLTCVKTKKYHGKKANNE